MNAADETHDLLVIAAAEVLDALFPEDRNALLDTYGTPAGACEAMTHRAEKVLKKLTNSGTPAPPEEYPLVTAAGLTRVRDRVSVAANTNNAANKFSRYRCLPNLPIGLLVRTDQHISTPSTAAALLIHSEHVRRTITGTRTDIEPDLILNLVIPATIAALRPELMTQQSTVDVDAAVTDVAEVLDRGAALAASLRVLGRSAAAGAGLPVVGNTDFLVRIAAYRVAIQERGGRGAGEPLDDVARAVAEFTSILGKAMRHPPGWRNRRGHNEPDVATAFAEFAKYLGSVRGTGTTRDAVKAVHAVLNHRLGLIEPSDEIVIDDAETRADPSGGDPADAQFADVEHHVGWLVSALFAETNPVERSCLLHWLTGRTVPDAQHNLPLLVRRLRLATARLDEEPTLRPPRPACITEQQFTALVARLARDVKPSEIEGNPRFDARRVTLAALPPLWTLRDGVIRHVASHLRVLLGSPEKADRDAEILARHGVRAPMQFVDRSAARLREPCCPDAGNAGRPAPSGRPRPPVPGNEICPHRPWGETGLVENNRSLADAAGCTDEAVRKRTNRYTGPWRELMLP